MLRLKTKVEKIELLRQFDFKLRYEGDYEPLNSNRSKYHPNPDIPTFIVTKDGIEYIFRASKGNETEREARNLLRAKEIEGVLRLDTDYGKIKGVHGILKEYKRGNTLSGLEISQEDKMILHSQVAYTLGRLHEEGIALVNLSPENILITGDHDFQATIIHLDSATYRNPFSRFLFKDKFDNLKKVDLGMLTYSWNIRG